MLMMSQTATRTRFSDWPLAVKSILGFWLFYALTVVARAFLGTDPWTIVVNKLAVVGIGVVLTALIYGAITLLADNGSIRRKTITAAVASTIAAMIMGVTLIAIEDYFRESREQFRYQAREGFTVVEQGQTIRVERTAQERPAVFARICACAIQRPNAARCQQQRRQRAGARGRRFRHG